jgi:hypothetical protein
MNDMMRDMTSIGLAVVGVAILTVLVSQKNNTSSVIKAAATGFQQILSAAMGGALTAAIP